MMRRMTKEEDEDVIDHDNSQKTKGRIHIHTTFFKDPKKDDIKVRVR